MLVDSIQPWCLERPDTAYRKGAVCGFAFGRQRTQGLASELLEIIHGRDAAVERGNAGAGNGMVGDTASHEYGC